MTKGVRQGGVLSPYLFSIYVDELSILLTKSKYGCCIEGVTTNHLFYADDLCILAPSPMGLQGLLDICSDFGNQNDVLFNPLKSMCLVFKPQRYSLTPPCMCIGQNKLDYVEKVKYLGVYLTNTLSDKDDIMRQLRSLYSRANYLLCKYSQCSVNPNLCFFNLIVQVRIVPIYG